MSHSSYPPPLCPVLPQLLQAVLIHGTHKIHLTGELFYQQTFKKSHSLCNIRSHLKPSRKVVSFCSLAICWPVCQASWQLSATHQTPWWWWFHHQLPQFAFHRHLYCFCCSRRAGFIEAFWVGLKWTGRIALHFYYRSKQSVVTP